MPVVEFKALVSWAGNSRWVVAGVGFVAGFLVALLIFGAPWHLPPDWGDIPTWFAASFAGIAGIAAVSQLGVLREQINDDAARNTKRDLLMDRQLGEAERRAEAEFRRQAEDVEVRWVQRAEMAKGFVTMVIVTNKSRRPISRIACRAMSNVDGATIKVPDASGVMPQAQEDQYGGVMVDSKPVREFALLGPEESCGFVFNNLRREPDQIVVTWFTDDAGNRWQLDETMHLVRAAADDEYKK